MEKEVIAVDMDQVMADLEPPFIDLFKETYDLTFDSANDYLREHPEFDLASVVKELYPMLNTYKFFRQLPVMKDSQKVLRELSDHYDIYIASAAMEVPKTFTAKYEWLEEHFPFLNPQRIVFCGDKKIIKADYLIDDSIRQLKRFSGTGLLYTSTVNQDETAFIRVNSWMDVYNYFMDKID